jgi:hypothetical protein
MKNHTIRLNRLTAAILLSGILLAGTAGDALAQNRAALLTEVSGSVEVTRASGGGAVAASWGMQLFEGDRVTTGTDGSAAVLYADNRIASVGTNGALTVSASGGQSGASRSVSSDRIADVSDLTLHRAGEGEIAALGGLRAGARREAIVAMAPRHANVLAERPEFHWEVSSDFEEFRISVRDATGEIWAADGVSSGVAYPAGAPALEPGRQYYWQVTGIRMLDEVDSGLSPFVVLDEAERRAISESVAEIHSVLAENADENSRDFLLGSLYSREGLLGEAVDAFSRIAERHPDSPLAHEILGKLYFDMGLKDQSIESLTKALASSR